MADYTENQPYAFVGVNADNRLAGNKITMGVTGYQLKAITQGDNTAGTTAYVYTAAKTLIASQAMSGKTATFSSPISLIAGTSYYVLVGSGTSSFNADYSADGQPFGVGTYLTWTNRVFLDLNDSTWAEGTNARHRAIKSLTLSDLPPSGYTNKINNVSSYSKIDNIANTSISKVNNV